MSRTFKIELPCKRELNFHVFPVSAFNWDFWLNLEPLGRLLGSTWSFLGASWRQLGRSWDQLGANLGAPGTNLAPTWAPSDPSWDQLKPTLACHGRSCNALGALLGTLGRLWTFQGRSRLDFGAPKNDFDVSDTRFRHLRDSIFRPRRFRKSNPAAMYCQLPPRSIAKMIGAGGLRAAN